MTSPQHQTVCPEFWVAFGQALLAWAEPACTCRVYKQCTDYASGRLHGKIHFRKMFNCYWCFCFISPQKRKADKDKQIRNIVQKRAKRKKTGTWRHPFKETCVLWALWGHWEQSACKLTKQMKNIKSLTSIWTPFRRQYEVLGALKPCFFYCF